jgi:DNA repair exonuclease SbcCD nuclease subunit
MNKYIVLGDVHFGKSKGNPIFLQNQLDFFNIQLIPFMIKNKIDTIFQLGDFLDNRKTLDGYVYSNLIELFDKLKENNIKIVFPLGNHDIYWRESLEIHLVDIFRKIYPEVFTIITEETFFTINNKKVAFVPWLTEGSKVSDKVKSTEVILGHFGIKNFEVVKGVESSHGLEIEVFGGAKVYSGHFHNMQRKGNILYTGSPYQFDWGCYKENRGFWVTDFHSEDLFYENQVSYKHLKIIYDDVQNSDYPISLHGIQTSEIGLTLEEFLGMKETLQDHKVKFIINNSDSGDHMKCIQFLKSFEEFEFDITNNFQVSKIINADYAASFTEEGKTHSVNSKLNETENVIKTACEENNILHVLEEVIKIKTDGA